MVQIQFESPKKLFSIAHEPAHSGLLLILGIQKDFLEAFHDLVF